MVSVLRGLILLIAQIICSMGVTVVFVILGVDSTKAWLQFDPDVYSSPDRFRGTLVCLSLSLICVWVLLLLQMSFLFVIRKLATWEVRIFFSLPATHLTLFLLLLFHANSHAVCCFVLSRSRSSIMIVSKFTASTSACCLNTSFARMLVQAQNHGFTSVKSDNYHAAVAANAS